jgi:hypothetical protein
MLHPWQQDGMTKIKTAGRRGIEVLVRPGNGTRC